MSGARNLRRGIDTARPDLWPAERIDRFWSFVGKVGSERCWPWRGKRVSDGEGRYAFHIEGKMRWVYAHRAAWILTEGPIPPGHSVWHRCSNLACCNPRHLVVGPPSVYGQLIVLKGSKVGERNHFAKLTAAQVRVLRKIPRERFRRTMKNLVARYGVSANRLRAIWRGVGWRGVG